MSGKKEQLANRLEEALSKEDPDHQIHFNRPDCSVDGAQWGNSEAKKIMFQDLLDGLVPLEKMRDVEKLFNQMHAGPPEFKEFPFDKENCEGRFSRLQTTVRRLRWAAAYDEECTKEAREKFPRQTHYSNGKKIWRGSEADAELAKAMEKKVQEQDGFKPLQLWKTKGCYQQFSKTRFSKRVDQLREAAKPHGENPMQTAAKKKKKKKMVKVKPRPEISRASTTAVYMNTI